MNAQSINNKPGLIHDIIIERHIDICCIVETWQKPQEFMALNKATPPGYVYIQKPRLKGAGGGLAVIHRADIHTKEVAVTTATSFECVAFTLAGFSQLQFVLVYRPPKNTSSDRSAFLSELSELLTPVCAMSPSTYLLGDMNCHVDSSSCTFANEFMSLLECFNFSQHVRGPTHNRGHTLDLVCSTGTPPTDLQCLDLAVSDHHAIAFSVPASLSRQRPKRTITFRNIKAVSAPALSTLIAGHLAGISTDPSDGDLVSSYNTALIHSLDSLAPIKTQTVSFNRPAPWFTPELRAMKSTGRRLERLYKKSGLTVHHLAYRDHVKDYKTTLSQSITQYYSTLIGSQEHHPRKLFSTVNKLLSPLPPVPASGDSDLCSRFLDFFQNKVDTIHRQLQTSATCLLTPQLQDTAPSATCPPFTSFTPVEESLTIELVTKAKASSCSLDPMPTTLVKACLPTLAPIITNIINSSIQSGTVPTSFKTASVTPILKKPGLDPEDLTNYRPISNLPFLSKTLERVVAAQLQQHLSDHRLFEPFQSGYRAHHSTETALVKITNDLLMAADSGKISILILLDLSAAFDTVSHSILLNRLTTHLNITGSALSWFHSYLSNRLQFVSMHGSTSHPAPVYHGVPQGSVLGPILFTIYMLPLGQIIRKHGLDFHCYADDTQIYLSTSPTTLLPPPAIVNCIQEIKTWLTTNLLQLNSKKTELMLMAPRALLRKIGDFILQIDGCSISPSSEVRNLGVILDSTLSFQTHIKSVTKSAFFHLKNISRLRPSLSDSVAETLIHAFVSSRLDYCNGVLFGLPKKDLDRLQYVQNSAARVLTRTKPWQHITPTLKRLHWLPVKDRITYKLLLLTFKALHGLAPQYLSDLLEDYTPGRTLRSSDLGLLTVRQGKRRSLGDRAFSVAAPARWNSLPFEIRHAKTLDSFKSALKRHLFVQAFGL